MIGDKAMNVALSAAIEREGLPVRFSGAKKKTPQGGSIPRASDRCTDQRGVAGAILPARRPGRKPEASLFRWRSRQSCEKYGRLLTAAAQNDSAITPSRATLTPCAPHRDVVATTVSLKPLRRLLSRTGKAEYRARAFREDRGREAKQQACITGKRGLLPQGMGK